LVEAMACELPCVAVDRFGPAHIVRDGETGWLVEPDDVGGLADALVEVVNDAAERRRRGMLARREARERFSWPALTAELAGVLEDARATPAAASRWSALRGAGDPRPRAAAPGS
ncbi:MAG TPA: glycosyltransferase, partial [Solirubrobacteraceae bacterium]